MSGCVRRPKDVATLYKDRATTQGVLATDFSQDFVELMRQRVIADFGRYGPLESRLESFTVEDSRDVVNKLLDEYTESKYLQLLADGAYKLMALFMKEAK